MAKTAGRVRIETGRKRVRAYLDGELVADTRHPFLVWEWPYFPAYYFPAADVQARADPGRGDRALAEPRRRAALPRQGGHGHGGTGGPALPGLAAGGPARTWSGWTGTR